jgi:hypothetical protein
MVYQSRWGPICIRAFRSAWRQTSKKEKKKTNKGLGASSTSIQDGLGNANTVSSFAVRGGLYKMTATSEI